MSRAPEEGFILIAALWILLLCGAIGSLLLLRGLEARKDVEAQSTASQARFDTDSAIETVVSDLLLKGSASRWAHLPARGTVDLDGRATAVQITSEDGRIDINEVDPAYLDRALQSLKVSRSDRALVMQRLNELRATGRRLSSITDVQAIFAGINVDDLCPLNIFTVSSGLAQPDSALMAGSLAAAVGAIGERGSGEWRPGMALRVAVVPQNGSEKRAIVRIAATSGGLYRTLAILPNSC